jgi:hypothetical protein
MAIIASGSFCTIATYQLAVILRSGKTSRVWLGPAIVLLICLAATAFWAFSYVLKKLASFLDASAQAQAIFLDTLNDRYADIAILFCAALSLFLELRHHQVAILDSPIHRFL